MYLMEVILDFNTLRDITPQILTLKGMAITLVNIIRDLPTPPPPPAGGI